MQAPYTAIALVAMLASAPAGADATRPDLLCPVPISTCRQGTGGPECPAGFRCACVPSCPNCRDCAAQVCVPEQISKECKTACDCPPGLGCADGRCVAGIAPVFCCESDRCPIGQQCQHRDGRSDRCGQQCRTACDCEPGLGCFDGQCIAGIAPVFCCDGAPCPAGQQCQHRDGHPDRCGQACVEQVWRCDTPGERCEPDRVCACSASCPQCEDCGPGVCVPPGTATPYRCGADGACAQPGDRCVCVPSCPDCDDCTMNVCLPSCTPACERNLRVSSARIDGVVAHTRQCRTDAECVHIDTSSGCRGTCGAWVNQRYAKRVQRLISFLDQRYCSTYQRDGCPFSAPRCADERGACVRGLCTGVAASAAE